MPSSKTLNKLKLKVTPTSKTRLALESAKMVFAASATGGQAKQLSTTIDTN